jgi:hypothetical protein
VHSPTPKRRMHTMQKGHNPLGNRVTFDLIDMGRLCVAQVAGTTLRQRRRGRRQPRLVNATLTGMSVNGDNG